MLSPLMWLLDVNVTKKVQNLLEERGEDVVTLIDLGYRRLRNGEVLAKAKELNRVLLSYDRDFIQLTQGTHPGVVVLRIHPCIDEKIIPALKHFLTNLNEESLPNHLIVLERTQIITRNTKND